MTNLLFGGKPVLKIKVKEIENIETEASIAKLHVEKVKCRVIRRLYVSS